LPGRLREPDELIAMAEPAQPVSVTIEAEPALAVSGSSAVPEPAFSSLWELAVAVNRSDPTALAIAANGGAMAMPIEGAEVRKLLGTLWFRAVVPRMSDAWKERILDVLAESVSILNHRVKRGRNVASLSDLSGDELKEVSRGSCPDSVRPDLDLLLTVGRLFGDDSLKRMRFVDPPLHADRSRLAGLLHGLRHGDGTPAPDGQR
jgi:hypothetical protein